MLDPDRPSRALAAAALALAAACAAEPFGPAPAAPAEPRAPAPEAPAAPAAPAARAEPAPPSAPSPQADLDAAAELLRRADADRDGDVAAAEWAAFLDGLGADAGGNLDARRVIARVAFADVDGDGALTREDVGAALADDAPVSATRVFLAAIADSDGDGALSPEERDAFLAPLPDGPLGDDVTMGWVRAVEALPPPPEEDRGRRVPPVVLAGILPVLDADGSGALTLDDLNALHRGADASGDGVVDASEIAARQGPVFGRWEVDPAARERPPLMPWQRTLEDALLVAERTGKPLLLCVNVDGENASEFLAYGRYRDPDFARLAGGFVCLLASPDSHGALERDDRGRRIPDERFGRLVCSEHVAVEPLLFERWFRDLRVAPRHVGVAPDGSILFDLYLLQDLSIVDAKLAEHGRPAEEPAPEPSALSTEELLASADAGLRAELERRFVASEPAERAALAARALEDGRRVQHPELVHLALSDPDPAVRATGARLCASAPASFPLALVPAALAVAAEPERGPAGDGAALRDALADGLARAATLAEQAGDRGRASDARFLRRVLAALERKVPALDPARWRALLAAGGRSAPEPTDDRAFDATVDGLEAVDRALEAAPEDAALLLRRAELLARLARHAIATGRNPLGFLADAEQAAGDALAAAPGEGRALGLRAWAIYQQNRVGEAGDAAAAALPALAREATSALALDVLGVLAGARTQAVYDAIGAGTEWDEQAAAEALAAHAVLCAHPDADESRHVRRLELLGTLRAFHLQRSAAREAVLAFPASETLHGWLRFVELRDGGARALEQAYAELPRPEGLEPTLDWFHGLATLFAAEHDARCRDAAAARGAYGRAERLFAASAEAEPAFASSAAHYRALALAGRARLDLAAGDLDAAAAAAAEALRAAPGSAEQPDGLGRTPAETARGARDAARAGGREDLADALEAALAEAGLG